MNYNILKIFKKKKIQEQVIKEVNIIERRELLDKAYLFDSEGHKDFTGKLVDKIIIGKGVAYIKKELKLDSIHIELDMNDIYNLKEKTISSRQYYCLIGSIVYINNNKFGSAYHELCDFIHNYGSKKSINLTERTYISILIKLLDGKLKVNE